MEWVYLVLIAAVLIFGFAVLLVGRRGPKADPRLPPTPTARIERPPRPAASGSTAVLEPPVVEQTAIEEIELAELDVVAPPEPDVAVVERPTFRTRMGKARSALAGAFLGIRGRAGITEETWDDLEEALLRADVGVRVTEELLSGLRTRVKAKEITDPDSLLDALQA